jgi:hypothetical protein
VGDRAVIVAGHGRHDPLLVAAEADRVRGRHPTGQGHALLTACAECAGLHADLVALAAAMPGMATPPRRRDFTLTLADVERLRPRGIARLIGLVGSPRDTVTRPLALAFTTLGLAGLLVTAAPGVLPAAGDGVDPTPVASDTTRLEMPPAASAGGGFQQETGGGTETTGEAPFPPALTVDAPAAEDGDRFPVAVLSGAFLAIGGGLFVIRRRAVMR